MTNNNDYLAELKTKFAPYFQYASGGLRGHEEMRCTLDAQLLVEIHQAVGEELDGILKILDTFPMDDIPEQWQDIANLVMFLVEIDSPVVKWVPRYGLAHLPDALDPRHFETKRNFYDLEPSRGRTLMADRIR